MVYIRQGIQQSVLHCATTNPMELKKVTQLARRRQFSTTIVCLHPHRSDYSSNHQNDKSWHDHLPKESSVVYGDFNAHHSSWNEYVSTDRGSALYYWMERHARVLRNEGSPTRAARCDKSAGISAPDVSLVDTVMADRFTLETISELGSDHFPLLFKWGEDI